MSQPTQKPVRVFRAGNVRIPVWENSIEQHGKTVVRLSGTPGKRFYDKQAKQWRDTLTFFPEDFADLEMVARKAHEFCRLREESPDDASFDPEEIERQAE